MNLVEKNYASMKRLSTAISVTQKSILKVEFNPQFEVKGDQAWIVIGESKLFA